MKWISLLFAAFKTIPDMINFIRGFFARKKRKDDVQRRDKEIDKSIEDGNIDQINRDLGYIDKKSDNE